ncbi:MAG: DNA-directed RNA polymerase subunit alpha C-terminal domain-containing protein [Mycoplasmatota bacterium]
MNKLSENEKSLNNNSEYSIDSFDGLNISLKVYYRLRRAGIDCPRDLNDFTINDLLTILFFEESYVKEVVEKVLLVGVDIMQNTKDVEESLNINSLAEKQSIYSFNELKLSTRAHSSLVRAGISCPSDMSDFTLERLREIEKIGPVMAEEIVDKLLLCGIDIIENSAKKIIDDKKPSQDKPVKTYVK